MQQGVCTRSVADGDLDGRWSMLDLAVISLTMSLINRNQISHTMGPAAFYFGAADTQTILAGQNGWTAACWDTPSRNARFDDEAELK